MENLFSSWSFAQLFSFFTPRILFALFCGGLIGLERELKHKAAGIKTNMLICVGSAIYTAVSMLISTTYSKSGFYGDPARVAAQIVSGIGFLGGGAIIQSRGTISGMTTAATIWVVAAIGICIGLGYILLAIASTIIVVSVLVAVTFVEEKFMNRYSTFESEILAEDPEGRMRKQLNESLERHDLILEDFDLILKGTLSLLRIRYRGNRRDHKRFILGLWATPGIHEVKQS